MSKRRISRGRKNERKPKNRPTVTGRVQMTRDGFIFVVAEGQEDIFVKASKTRQALNGDTVRVVVTREGGSSHKREGEVVEIVERSSKPFVGVYHTVGAQAWVLMQSKSMPYDIEVDVESAAAMGAKPGMKVAAVVDEWHRREPAPKGHLVDVLGLPGENNTEMHAILAEYGLPYRFERAVEEEAAKIPAKITSKDLKGRRDFRDILTFTIDPADAKDFDDAISFRVLGEGRYEVGVHIADVSYYVKPGSLVDKEAQARGTSVYLVDRTVPMLPEALCNNLCSLRPGEDKLTFSAVFEMDDKATVLSHWFGRTIIRSDHRFDYEQAQAIIEAGASGQTTSAGQTDGVSAEGGRPVDAAIVKLNDLALRLRRKRFANGAISFERPEMKVEVDAEGRPLSVYQKISKEANWLIEEFMLLANRSVAEFIASDGKMNGGASRKAKTFVYRVHDTPNEEKLQGLREFVRNFGLKLEKAEGSKGTAKALNSLFNDAKGRPEFSAIEMIALRAMAKASYSTDNIGHYGLAFRFYTHFTSPIRRYPDMMVHRLLAMYMDGADSQNKDYYEEQCHHASEREIIAANAERDSVKYKLVEFMQDKVGQEFDGMISGVTEWGIYVEIEPTKIEGMVPLRTIRSDFFEFDEDHYRIVGRRTHKSYHLGDRVRIVVKGANLEQRLLDYELV